MALPQKYNCKIKPPPPHTHEQNHIIHTYTKAQEESYRQAFKVYFHFHQVVKWKPCGDIQPILRLIWGLFGKDVWFFDS